MRESFFKTWWRNLVYEPNDPRLLAGSDIKIAAIGGGTGLSVLLSGLKKYSNNISAIVAVTDDGSSTGVIRKEFDILPPGDIRKCISALAEDGEILSKILEYRFPGKNKSLSNHTLGNIWIAALTKHLGSFEQAIEATSTIFRTAGKILPATLDNIKIGAVYAGGKKILGEDKIPQAGKKINIVFLNKDKVRAYEKAVQAINEADLILLGPGSLYTSVIPNLLIPGIKKAILSNKIALKIYIANISTERGETENYSVSDHIAAIKKHAPGKIFDYCLVNSHVIKKSKQSSKLGEVYNITTENEKISGVKISRADLVDEKKPLYHDNTKLAKMIIKLYNNVRVK
ncbi:MAG: gluconeogenesis factor YvcK family protein [Patescibacteria group bacterium]|jgi:uncharacterized cofD-like protein